MSQKLWNPTEEWPGRGDGLGKFLRETAKGKYLLYHHQSQRITWNDYGEWRLCVPKDGTFTQIARYSHDGNTKVKPPTTWANKHIQLYEQSPELHRETVVKQPYYGRRRFS